MDKHYPRASYLKQMAYIAVLFVISTGAPAPIAVGADEGQRSDFAPSLSPDDRYVVYYSYRAKAGNLPDLFIYDRVSNDERLLTETPTVWEIEPQWSADGALIYFSGGPSMQALEFEAITPDRAARNTISLAGMEGPANISPDGRFAAARTPYGDNEQSELAIVALATGEVRVIKTGLEGKNTGPNWSPDGRSLVFKHLPAGQSKNPEIYRILIDGGQAQQLTHNNIEEFKLSWSGDGRTIYFMGNVDHGPSHIYRVSANGGASVRMTHSDDAPAYFPALSRDNSTVFFSGTVSNGETRIMHLSADAVDEKATLLESGSIN